MQLMKIFIRQFQNSLYINFYVAMTFELVYIQCRSSQFCRIFV